MKHLKKFESFSVNEEILGLPSLSEIKAKVKSWFEANKNNPELAKAIQAAKDEYAKLDDKSKASLNKVASETPEEVKSDLEKSEVADEVSESMINEAIDWKNLLAKFFKVLGVVTVSVGFITAIAAIINIAIAGTGYAPMLGTKASIVGATGMVTMLAALIPMAISIVLKPEAH